MLVLRWRVPDPAIRTRWRGPEGMLEALRRDPDMPLAAIIGPPGPTGPQGPVGSPLRFDAGPNGTWIFAHGLGRMPAVQVFLDPGEAVLADIAVDFVHITVTFAAASSGFVLVS